MIDLKSIAADVKPLIFQAGDTIRDVWESNSVVSHSKDESDVVTETDVEVEEYLRKYLYRVLPQAGFIVEEGKTEMMGEFNWTIDPIDGTKYFASQVPSFFTQVALLRNNEPVISFIYQPISKQLFHAIKGYGAYLNDEKITIKVEKPLKESLVHVDFGAVSGSANAWKFSLFQKVAQECYRVRASAGYLLPYLALGAIDIAINIDARSPQTVKNITDLAPHTLFLTEAGYREELVKVEGRPMLIWASKQHITEIKSLLI